MSEYNELSNVIRMFNTKYAIVINGKAAMAYQKSCRVIYIEKIVKSKTFECDYELRTYKLTSDDKAVIHDASLINEAKKDAWVALHKELLKLQSVSC